MVKPETRSYSHLNTDRRTHERMDVPIRLFVKAIGLFNLIKRVLFERSLHPVQDVEDMVLFRSPRPEARSKVECAVLLGYKRMKYVRKELHDRGTFWVVRREHQPELQDRVGIVA